jgi:hypothetical protein
VNEGGDVIFGGPGRDAGQFMTLVDIVFDPKGVLYALDGVQINNSTKQLEGNLRVQKFDQSGKVLGTIDLKGARGIQWNERNTPQRVAADSQGNVFVTVPNAGQVLQWNASGIFVRAFDMPGALAVTLWKHDGQERIAVVPSVFNAKSNGEWDSHSSDKIVILSPQGGIEYSIVLPQSYKNVRDVTSDRDGNFYLKTEPNAIHKISPQGKLLKTFGGNETTRNTDGSEVLHTVAVDSKGNVYTMAWGNPGWVTRFDANGQTLTQREGQFQWGDPWSIHSNYVPLAVSPDDRLWVAAPTRHAPDHPHLKRQRAVPAILRTKTDFLAPANGVRQISLKRLGFKPALQSALPQNISYDTNKAVPLEIRVGAANRNVSAVRLNWRVFDAVKKEIAKGETLVPLQNGKEAKTNFLFTPTRYGSYFVHAAFSSNGQSMGALGEHIGVTPRYANLPSLEGEPKKGGWEDASRQMWTGLPNVRLHLNKGLDQLDKDLKRAEELGATVLVQLIDDQKKFNADEVRALINRFKGRIKYIEICNEPNFSGSPEDYFRIHQQAYRIIKAADPNVRVMGPATVNLSLDWLKRLYAMGLKDVTDIISLHDYEGHESISPEHWRWKLGEVRKIMAQNGDAAKPLWQTERAIAGVRGNNFQGLVQAIRTTLHRDLLETLGIPTQHNNHYYLNQGGYSSVPTYVWSDNGPHPAALALRTRHALTSALKRRYVGTLDFGTQARELLMGVRYSGNDGETVVLRNLGTRDMPLSFSVSGAKALDVVDTWGNTQKVAVGNGKAQLVLQQLPLYVRLPRGAKLTAPKLHFGTNIARAARFEYSNASQGDLTLLSNGEIETYHDGNPKGGTDGKAFWTGDMPNNSRTKPVILTASFKTPRTVSAVVLRGVRPDNAFSTLLDYELQGFDGKTWKAIERVKRPMPPSEDAVTADSTHAMWMDDTNFFVHRFAPVTVSKLRLVVRDTTRGFMPDDRTRAWGNVIPRKLMLREIEIYAPVPTTR